MYNGLGFGAYFAICNVVSKLLCFLIYALKCIYLDSDIQESFFLLLLFVLMFLFYK